MTRICYDSVTPARVPADAKMVLAYLDSHAGRYATPEAMRKRCPHAQIVTITVKGGVAADVVDCETGDASPDTAAAWARRMVDAGRHPTIYCNASTWPDVKRAVARVGLTGKVSYFIAHYDNDPTIPAGAVAKQYRNDVRANLDTSSVADYWPGVDPAPAPPKPAPADVKKAAPAWYRRDLHAGSIGQDVQSMQVQLKIPGRLGGFGPRTIAAVKYIQKAHGLPITGRVDRATAVAIGPTPH